MLMAFASLLFAILNRSISAEKRFIMVPSLTRPLLFFAAVVVVTGMFTGGIGLYSFGSAKYGGKNYFYVLLAIAGYFAFTSQRIPLHQAMLYVGLFFLAI